MIDSINQKSDKNDEELDLATNTMRSMKLPYDAQDKVTQFLMFIQQSPDL